MIEVRNLYKSFGTQKVLDGVNLTMEKGKTTVIVGPSGCGKSVLIKHIIGLLKPDRGQILIDGEDIGKYDDERKAKLLKRFGFLFQSGALFDSMSLAENVSFPLREHTRLSEKEIMAKVEEKLKLVGLGGAGNKYPAELSGGMKKRAGLARAIALDPDIIIFDEPTTGLDPVMSDAVDTMIRETQEYLKFTAVAISHDMASTFKIGHKVAMLYNGKIVEEGTPEEFKRSKSPVVRQFLARKAEGPIKV